MTVKKRKQFKKTLNRELYYMADRHIGVQISSFMEGYLDKEIYFMVCDQIFGLRSISLDFINKCKIGKMDIK